MAVVLLSVTALTAGLLLAGRFYIHRQLLRGLDDSLEGRAMSVAALVRYPEDGSTDLVFERGLLPASLDPRGRDKYQVIGPNGQVLEQSKDWPKDWNFATSSSRRSQYAWLENEQYRTACLRNVPILDEETGIPVSAKQLLTVSYATSTEGIGRQLTTLTAEIAASGLVLLIMSGLIVLLGIRHSLRPLRDLAEQAGAVSPRNWSFAAPESARSVAELQPLIASIDTMLGGLQRAFDQQRDFLASAAHELKTPVAIQKSSLQLLIHKPRTADEYRSGLRQCLTDTERLEDLLQRLLRLARADQWAQGAANRDLTPQLLSASCEASVARFRDWATTRGVALNLVTNGDLRVLADADDLELIWGNLLENAIRYSPSGKSVTVTIAHESQAALVSVADEGCGIGAEELPRIFERFYRGDPSRSRETGGVGLGLAIVKTLVEAYGGSTTVSSEPDVGTTFVVRLPAISG